ncbi:acyl-CoA dehydrogenase family protein [Rhodococcus globerulus]|uniref:acyl-CoA dehydrogenase family protein n=1 Tax=Rhodococcus globerulus TaxID=33008 RepID=UPI000A6E36FD|nr:acyl-CoA dehydrogenase family protein [Rhodococcus globerulus]
MPLVSMPRNIFDTHHEAFRETVRGFTQREVLPHLNSWAAAGRVDRSLFRKAGELGLLGFALPERFGGSGVDDFRFNAVLIEELASAGAHAVSMSLSAFNDLIAPYIDALGTKEQKQRWLPSMTAGETIGAIAMTEPNTGSDLKSMSTTARQDGDSFVLNGTKTFISSGILADIVIVAARTDNGSQKRLSLLVVEDGMPGFTKIGPLNKVGLSAQDTAELIFEDVRVPRANLLGEAGQGFHYLRHNLPQERLNIAITSMALARRSFDQALTYSLDRSAFGQRIADFQANRFYLAELATELEIAQTFVDRCISEAASRTLDDVTAAMAKWWITELHLRVVNRSVQLHGGYGFMREYDTAKDYLDSRATTIYGGTTEIMKEIIGRKLTT